MRKLYTILTALLGVFIPIVANDTLTLDLSSVLASYTQTVDGYWEQTYDEDVFVECEPFRFSHTGSSDGGGGMAYWEGFTLCTSGDQTDYGDGGSSEGWVAHQWGCMAGGGLNAQGVTTAGAPYLVAYWGYFMESMDEDYHSLRVDFTDAQPHKLLSVSICNHPWPYYGNINGDGFASAFTKEGDYFAVVIHGLNQAGEPTGTTVHHELASFHNGQLVQSDEWQEVDLRPLGTVSGIYFTMETSDEDEIYGANTAVYFCLDRLRMLSSAAEEPLARPTGLRADSIGEDQIVLMWNSVEGADAYILLCDQNEVGVTSDTLYTFSHLMPSTEYALSVIAVNGNDSSETATLTVNTVDLTPPSAPVNLRAENTAYTITIAWDASTDNVGVSKYTVYLDGAPNRRTTDLSYAITGLEPNTVYTIEVEAMDEAGNRSEKASLVVTTATEGLNDTHLEQSIHVYTIQGVFVGTQWPTQSGTYIIKTTNNIQTTIIY